MKTLRSTFILLGLVASVGGFAVWDYFQTQKKEEREKKEALVFELAIADIQRLELQSDSGLMVLERSDKDADFALVEPIEDEVDQDTVRFWLEDVFNQTAKPLQSGSEIVWSQFDLEPVKRQLKLKTFGGNEYAIAVSQDSAFDGSLYLKKGESLLLGGTPWARLILKAPKDLRSKKLLRSGVDLKKLSQIEIRSTTRSSLLIRQKTEGEGWHSPTHQDWIIASSEVEAYLRDLESIRFIDFVNDAPSEKELRAMGLGEKASEVRLSFAGQEQPLILAIKGAPLHQKGASDDQLLVISDRPFVYKTSKRSSDLLFAGGDRFRDKEYPFNLDLATSDQIILDSSEKVSGVLKKVEGLWSLENSGEGLKADPQRLDELIKKVQSLKVKSFRTQKEWMNSKGSKSSIAISSEQKKLLEISWKKMSEESFLVQSSRSPNESFEVDGWRMKEIEDQWPIEKIKSEGANSEEESAAGAASELQSSGRES